MRFTTPAAFATEPELDAAVLSGFDTWYDAARERGAAPVTKWLERRVVEDEFPWHDVFRAVNALVSLPPDADQVMVGSAAMPLAERLDPIDEEMVELCLQPVLRWGMDVGDAELLASAGERRSEILLAFAEPRAVAQLWIELLNWSRLPDKSVPVDLIFTALDYVISAASMDGAPGVSATLEYRQAQLHRQFEATGVSIAIGDWLPGSPPFEMWS